MVYSRAMLKLHAFSSRPALRALVAMFAIGAALCVATTVVTLVRPIPSPRTMPLAAAWLRDEP